VNRVLVTVGVALVGAFAAVGILAGEEEEAEPAGPPPVTERVQEVARSVERVRELRFDRLPRVRVVSAEEATRDSLHELDRSVPPRELRIGERLLVMLGLLPPDVRLREVLGEPLTAETAGYYIPRTGTLALVRGVGLDGLVGESTLAHELTHALEDQHFGLEPGDSLFLRDRAGADVALLEGTATVAMVDYLVVEQSGGRELPAGVRRQVLDELQGIAVPASSGLPPYVRESLVFPYAAGARFVDHIQSRDGWAAVDRAFEEDPPVSTEQVMHPRKYDSGERPVRVRLRGHRAALPKGTRVVGRGDIGEFDTAQFLREANGRRRSDEAAAGWGGSAFELSRLPGGGDVLVMRWAWDSPRDAADFAEAARRSVSRLDGAGAVNGGKEGVVAVVLAPEAALARRVARQVALR
jgi:hypothetical protein